MLTRQLIHSACSPHACSPCLTPHILPCLAPSPPCSPDWMQETQQCLPRWRAFKMGLLQRVGVDVQGLTVHDCGEPLIYHGLPPADLLAPLRPGVLRELHWQACCEPLPPALLEALPRLAGGLTRLKLFCEHALPAELPGVLQACSQLEKLCIRGLWPLRDLRPLTALRRLQRLDLVIPLDSPPAGALLLPARAELAPGLEWLGVTADEEGGTWFEASGAAWRVWLSVPGCAPHPPMAAHPSSHCCLAHAGGWRAGLQGVLLVPHRRPSWPAD